MLDGNKETEEKVNNENPQRIVDDKRSFPSQLTIKVLQDFYEEIFEEVPEYADGEVSVSLT